VCMAGRAISVRRAWPLGKVGQTGSVPGIRICNYISDLLSITYLKQ